MIISTMILRALIFLVFNLIMSKHWMGVKLGSAKLLEEGTNGLRWDIGQKNVRTSNVVCIICTKIIHSNIRFSLFFF